MAGLSTWVDQSVRSRVTWFTDQLRSGPAGETPIPGLTWNVTDLARHVAALPAFWDSQHDAGADFEPPTDMTGIFDRIGHDIPDTDPARLADLIDANFDDYLNRLAATDGPRWEWGEPTTPDKMAGLALNELILHGRDLALVTGAAGPTFEQREANLAVDAIMATTAAFVDPVKARAQPDGVYHFHFRGGNDYTWTKRGAELTIAEGRPANADARLNADPAAFLMTSMGRMSSARAGLTGAMIAYGRKPWRFAKLGTMMFDDM